jgi:hypothetical protein
VAAVPKGDHLKVVDGDKNSPAVEKPATRPNGFRQTQVVASHQGDRGSRRRLETQDLGSTGAKVLRANATDATGSSGFPIGTSQQSLKVSLDDGRGTSRTISLPSVSFGSQRVLAQNSAPLLASARSDW